MLGLPSSLRKMLLPAYLFLVACTAIELAVAEALTLGWDLGLVALRLSKVGLRQEPLLQLDLLGR
jgi:hypothetical protein